MIRQLKISDNLCPFTYTFKINTLIKLTLPTKHSNCTVIIIQAVRYILEVWMSEGPCALYKHMCTCIHKCMHAYLYVLYVYKYNIMYEQTCCIHMYTCKHAISFLQLRTFLPSTCLVTMYAKVSQLMQLIAGFHNKYIKVTFSCSNPKYYSICRYGYL